MSRVGHDESRLRDHDRHGQHHRDGSLVLRRGDRLIVRLVIWSVFDSKTTIDELRESLPELVPPDRWIWNEASDRFGVIAHGEELPEVLGYAQDLIGEEPDVYEEFDAE